MSKLRHSLWAMLAAGLILAATAAAQSYPSQQIVAAVDGALKLRPTRSASTVGRRFIAPGNRFRLLLHESSISGHTDGRGGKQHPTSVADNAYIVNPFLMSKLPYDSLRDFVPVALLSSSSTTLAVVHPSLPVRSVKELIALARARPGELNYASGGNGTIPHLMGELLKSVAKISLVHIPYKSTALAIYAATSGEVTIAFGGIFAVKGLVESGRLRALAIASAARNPLMPAVPTFAETGWPAVDATGYRGLLAPAGTPREIIARLNAGANKTLQIPAVRARLSELGYDVLGGTPEDYGRVIRAEMDKWGKIIRDAGIKVQ